MRPALDLQPPLTTDGVAQVAAWLATDCPDPAHPRLASIGPSGTSADDVVRSIRLASDRLGAPLPSGLLLPTFGEVMGAVLDGRARYALVPSAYRDATAFHWHEKLSLRGVFVHPTPAYGLAACSARVIGNLVREGRGEVVLSAMSEVRHLFGQLAPSGLNENSVVHVPASSTSAAARTVADGHADLALCNELGRAENGLEWVAVRPPADMVWMLFGLTDEGRDCAAAA